MKLGFYQFRPRFGAKEENLSKIEAALNGLEADILVLPELCTTGYLFATREELWNLAEPIPDGKTVKRLANIARRNRLNLVAGIAEQAKDKLYNSALLITSDRQIHKYRKAHLFFHEKEIFDPGDTRFQVQEIDGVKIGILICFDYLFPEATRRLALSGAQIICHPSNLVLAEYGQLISRARAIENRIYWVLANRCGVEERGRERLNFTGTSQIISPKGKLLAQASKVRECLKVVEVDPDEAKDKWVTPTNNIFEDRREDLY